MESVEEAYRLLEVTAESSAEDIRKAYLLLVNVWHPDRFAHDPSLQARAQDKLKAINTAFDKIRDAPLRGTEQATAHRPARPTRAPQPAAAPSTGTELNRPRSAAEWFDLGVRLTANPIHMKAGDEVTWSNVSNLKSYFDGMKALQEAVRLKPDHAEAWYHLGLGHVQLSQRSEAMTAFRKALRYRPDHARAWISLGVAYAQLEQYGDVAEAFREAVRHRPTDASAWYTLGCALTRLKDQEQAIAAYKQALRFNPDFAEAWLALGVAYAFAGPEGRLEPEDAVAAIRTAVRLKPDLVEGWYRLGAALSGLRRHDEAMGALREAVRLKPDYTEAWFSLAVASRYSDAENARRTLREAHGQLKRLDRGEASRLRDLLPVHLRLALLV